MTPRFDALVEELAHAAFSVDAIALGLNTSLDTIGTIVRSVPSHEGRLLERGIAMLAGFNPDLVVLTQNIRLPVSKAAVELVEMNRPAQYRSLTLDADCSGRKSYTPDLIVLNSRTRVAHVVDVKRSLNSYETSRITDLKTRMLAASLIVPDLLYKEHRRLVAEDVRVVILNAENQRTDIEGGVWPLSHLDHLLEVKGAGEMMKSLQQAFRHRIEQNWKQALQSVSGGIEGRGVSAAAASPTQANDTPAAGPPDADAGPAPEGVVRFGFARIPIARTG
ncbi:hypothetical protein [Pseudorhizobium flavum]|uniref:Uncharacterized protein n=1 Tax=Pseudorhizobium flavum TaxID=1335061 RepID=A0A7W9YZJ4_9HYPH|nr:hypothetical protein [Pseudorhizobium flavum]MBB6180794.1 hypothetical protein [Pseudorhizobium flavum]CAD6602573.1 hypothetical protein RFYW14_01160 [Pseudorhizobium flavum]